MRTTLGSLREDRAVSDKLHEALEGIRGSLKGLGHGRLSGPSEPTGPTATTPYTEKATSTLLPSSVAPTGTGLHSVTPTPPGLDRPRTAALGHTAVGPSDSKPSPPKTDAPAKSSKSTTFATPSTGITTSMVSEAAKTPLEAAPTTSSGVPTTTTGTSSAVGTFVEGKFVMGHSSIKLFS